ncbi:hypothetical protein BGZ95_000678 [Linnemannia exigua]|uniref:Transmembrane protein n=1 Tax=Linnemannia exigua TaxID=604196 RepID=A0AAD4H4L2_9FUNG|nr:hypothetical protein BGZ95_000678 [Linnemannia exigua]
MDARFGYTGKGAWKNLTVGSDIDWREPYDLQKLFYTGPAAAGGNERLIFVTLDPKRYDSTGLVFGVFDTAKNSLEYAGSWSWFGSTYGTPKGIAQAGDELYLYSSRNGHVLLNAFSLKSLNTTEPVAVRTYNATSTESTCDVASRRLLHTTVYKGTYYLACGVSEFAAASRKGGLFTIKDILTNTTSFTPKVDIAYRQLESDYFIPVGGNTAGVAPFALLQRDAVVRSLILDGAQAGIIHDGTNVTVAETYGWDPSPRQPNTNTNSNKDSGGGLGVEGVIGVVFGLVFFIAAIFFLLRSRKNITAQTSAGDAFKPQQAPPGTLYNLQMHKETFRPDGPNSLGYPSHQLPVQPLMPSNTLPMAPITPVSVTATTQPLQTFQNQMLGLQFSSHPRPNFVTTVTTETTGYEQEQLPSPGAPTYATSSAWQPTPFVPPTRPSDFTGTGTASTPVNASSTTTTTTSAQAS